MPLQQCLLLVGSPGRSRCCSGASRAGSSPVAGDDPARAAGLRRDVLFPDQTLAYLLSVAAITGILGSRSGRRRGSFSPPSSWLLWCATKAEGVLLAGLLAVVLLAADVIVRRRGARLTAVLPPGPLAIVPWEDLARDQRAAHLGDRLLVDRLFDPGRPRRRIDRLDGRDARHGRPARQREPVVADPAAHVRRADRARARPARALWPRSRRGC